MSGLVLKLAPNERLLINGAVIENGERRGRLNILSPGAHILRLRDAIHPDDADTPVKRLCYQAQLVLSGDAAMEDMGPRLVAGIEELSSVFRDTESHAVLSAARRAADEGNAYYALKFLRQLMGTEALLLSVAQR